ncbi:MAG: hypothetical protein H7Z13_10180 [Ferruginibacter sp.]|nr:hypothetical protein [Ferruginibacter sp.]
MIKRRDFLKDITLASAGMSILSGFKSKAPAPVNLNRAKTLNAYYFRAHMYTLVPRHIREDLKWMADIGTNTVSLAILEQDLFAAVENVTIICNEAAKLNMEVHAVPSRWGGMVAGAPKVPSTFSVKNPQTWILKKDGTPLFNDISGVISSVHYPETAAFFKTSLDKMFRLWNIKGIIWDEPKSFLPDYSPKAIEKLGKDASWQSHIKAVIDFFADVNRHIKDTHPEISTSMFAYADSSDLIVNEGAKAGYLDFFGCDGRPWRNEDGGHQESAGKVLLGTGERFLKAARENGKKSLWLIENHNMRDTDTTLMDKRLPELIKKDIDQLVYYYYPRNIEHPDKNMNCIKKHLKGFSS